MDYIKERKKIEEKYKENMKMCANGYLTIAYLATFILIIIWLFKLLCNTKDEPQNRIQYINKDFENYYIEGEFCFENYEKFIINGALETFDIPLKKIKKYTRALLGTIFISISLMVFLLIFAIFKKACEYEDSAMCCVLFFYIIFLLSVILNIVFAIVLAHYYFKGKYSDFEEFSRCRFLTKRFKTDYDFIFQIKNEFKMPFVIILISEFSNFINIINDSSRNKI